MNERQKEIIQLISSLSSQSNESSNIILRAISQGITTGLSQGIASGNIAFSFQDVLSLASMFKPSNDVPLQLIQSLLPEHNMELMSLPHQGSTEVFASKGSTTETMANTNSHDSCQDSSVLPSSVHVSDVTVGNVLVHEPLESHRVSEAAYDNVDSSSISSASNEGFTVQSAILTRKRLIISDDESTEPLKTRLRHKTSKLVHGEVIDSTVMDGLLEDYISSSCAKLPESVIEANNKILNKHGKWITLYLSM
jgi:hypothetical protein